MIRVAKPSAVAVLIAAMAVSGISVDAQGRTAQGRAGAQGRGTGGDRQQPPPGGRGAGVSPREVQAQFDAYVVAQAEEALQVNEEQYPQFVRRVRNLQNVRRQARIERTRLIQRLNMSLRGGRQGGGEQPDLAAAIRAIDEHERATLGEVQKAYAALDEVLTPWQRARFRVLEDQLEQKKVQMMMRAQQPIRR